MVRLGDYQVIDNGKSERWPRYELYQHNEQKGWTFLRTMTVDDLQVFILTERLAEVESESGVVGIWPYRVYRKK